MAISDKRVIEFADRTYELCNHINTLVENMQTLLEEDKELLAIGKIGLVFSISACEEPVIIAEMGSKEGQEIAFKSLKKAMEETSCQN